MIDVKNATKRYDGSIVLDDVSVRLPAGGITSIIGPNGAGKSTLLSLISRLLPMSAGTITVDGLDVTKTPSNVLARRMSILRQDNHIALRLTVRDLVEFGRYPYSKGRLTEVDRRYVDQAIDYLGLAPLADRFLDELSGGQRQRAFVAMVLCQDTDYILLDEPLNNLDMQHAVSMMKQLKRLSRDFGKTIVIVLHDINFASCYSDNIVAMSDGRLALQGPPDEVIREDVLSSIYKIEMNIQIIDGKRICVYY
jgi:iron complex transport system ATP-binding protein